MNFAACASSSNYCLLAVSCPVEVCDQVKWLLCLPSRIGSQLVDFLRLLLSGNVETNSGPTKKDGASGTSTSVLETAPNRSRAAGDTERTQRFKGKASGNR